jgi:hypothetical protein
MQLEISDNVSREDLAELHTALNKYLIFVVDNEKPAYSKN